VARELSRLLKGSIMRIDIHIHQDGGGNDKVLETLILLTQNVIAIMKTNAELLQILTDLGTQLDKTQAEILAEIKKLQDAIAAAGGTTPEVDAALASVQAKVQALDDLNPDVVA
jgi:hypothetical protein